MLDHLAFETPKPKVIQGAKHDWELVIGMEVHAQVASRAKLFSGASTAFGAEPNSNVSFVDAAMPGMLPVINKFCVEQAIRTGLGLNAEIHRWSRFDRKKPCRDSGTFLETISFCLGKASARYFREEVRRCARNDASTRP